LAIEAYRGLVHCRFAVRLEIAVAKIGNFEIIEELGRGAMGVVFRGFDPAIGRQVAIKVIRAQAFATNEENQGARLRFAREAAAAGRLSHPNIVTVFQFGEEHDYQFLVMEFVAGKALDQSDPRERLPILRQLAGALDYAHAHGVVHRDVKPANVLMQANGQVKLTDFGIARISSQTMTQTGMTLGTPSYMAPEQVMASRVDGKADQFSLAVIAFELLTGRKPFDGPTSQAVMLAILQGERPAAHVVNPALPPFVSEVLRRGMSREPENRFPACVAFVGALEAALQVGVPRPPVLQATPQPAAPPPLSRKTVTSWRFGLSTTASATLVGVTLGAVTLLGVYAFQRIGSHAQVDGAVAGPSALKGAAEAKPGDPPRSSPPAERVTLHSAPVRPLAGKGRGASRAPEAKMEAHPITDLPARTNPPEETNANPAGSANGGKIDGGKPSAAAASPTAANAPNDIGGARSNSSAAPADLPKSILSSNPTRGDLGVQSGPIATNAADLAALRLRGDRNYTDIRLERTKLAVKFADIALKLEFVDIKRNEYTVVIVADDKTVEKKDRSIDEPVQFYTARGGHIPYELIIWQVSRNQIVGYLASPKGVPQLNQAEAAQISEAVVAAPIAAPKSTQAERGVQSGLAPIKTNDAAAVKRRGERNYIEVKLAKDKSPHRFGDITLLLTAVDFKKGKYTVKITADDKTVEKRDKNVNEPIQFNTAKSGDLPCELVIYQIGKDEVLGYLAIPKVR
jgi:tRNA A-37 threonylcarbamoyl transferase component Bud32